MSRAVSNSSACTAKLQLPGAQHRVVADARTVPILGDLLVFQDGSAAAKNAFYYADALVAGLGSGYLTGQMFGFYPPISSLGYSDFLADEWGRLRDETTAKADALFAQIRPRFDGGNAQLRRWELLEAEAPYAFARFASFTDLVVLGWPERGERKFVQGLLEASLFHAGCPTLVVPVEWVRWRDPAKILIAWNSSREACRALRNAMPLLRRAETVSVILIDDLSEPLPGRDPAIEIKHYLARNGVGATFKRTRSLTRQPSELVLEQAGGDDVDLIVSGAYGHSRLGEWLFGGFTRDILAETRIPLLMSH